jgi:DNA-binding response OmpR family regulator
MTTRVLVADDDEGLRQLYRLILQREGFEVIEAANGEQTLARAVDSAPTIILLDIMMPGMNGFEVCQRLKNDRRTDAVPVILVSAMEDVAKLNETLKAGADVCLKKPIGPHELVERMKSLLSSRNTAWAM